MLEDLVDFTRPVGRTIALEATDFSGFMTGLAAELSAETAPRQILLLLPSDPPAVTVKIEARHFSRIFYNLVNTTVDALQGSPGTITIRFATEPGQLRIEVEDTGPGIPPEYERTLFEPFAPRGKAHGTGLRLSICRKIATDHGGRIWAECHPDRGTLFFITLPLGA
jgi:signal transduction histidine kinase